MWEDPPGHETDVGFRFLGCQKRRTRGPGADEGVSSTAKYTELLTQLAC